MVWISSQHHMDNITSIRRPKVIFLVEQSALAEHQGKQCMTYFPCKVKVITGESHRNVKMNSLNEWIKRYDSNSWCDFSHYSLIYSQIVLIIVQYPHFEISLCESQIKHRSLHNFKTMTVSSKSYISLLRKLIHH